MLLFVVVCCCLFVVCLLFVSVYLFVCVLVVCCWLLAVCSLLFLLVAPSARSACKGALQGRKLHVLFFLCHVFAQLACFSSSNMSCSHRMG